MAGRLGRTPAGRDLVWVFFVLFSWLFHVRVIPFLCLAFFSGIKQAREGGGREARGVMSK